MADERVDCVAFTGSVETGKTIARVCADRVARINLELGGKDPFIVCEDVAAGVEVAARGGAWAAYLNAGQVCTSAERFYVMKPVYDDFVQAFVDHTETLVVGDPLDPATDIGPMVSADQRARVSAQVEARGRRRRDARARRRGGRPRPLLHARRSSPARPRRRTCCARRRSGPWRRSCRSASLDEAIELANSTRFGLGANVYTRDLATVVRCMREIKAGTVWFNDPLTDNDAGPFGGMKQSGLGRELGQEGLEAFQETKHVHIETQIAPKEWWYPYGGRWPALRRLADGLDAPAAVGVARQHDPRLAVLADRDEVRLVLLDARLVLDHDEVHVGVLPAGLVRAERIARRAVQHLAVPALVGGPGDLERLLGLGDVLGPVLGAPAATRCSRPRRRAPRGA